jgi:16S rRNA G966 N2-methylase RsmD
MIKHTRPGDICLETFGGSGSQVIAAERLGRRCFAVERNSRFCDVIVARWEQFTGRAAERREQGESRYRHKPINSNGLERCRLDIGGRQSDHEQVNWRPTCSG